MGKIEDKGERGDMRRVTLSRLEPNPWNANTFTEEKFENLKTSIKRTEGRYLEENPLLVRPLENGKLQIVDGEHRYRACKELGIEEIPAEVEEMSRRRAIILSVVLNKNRGKLCHFKLSKTLNEIYEPYSRDGLNQKELGKKIGEPRSRISHILRIYPRLKKCADPHTFSNSQLEELARVKNDFLREKLVEQVKEKNWSSKTIRTKATKLNKFTEYIQEKTDKKELQQKIVKGLYDKLEVSLIQSFEISALKNEVDTKYKEVTSNRIIQGDCIEVMPSLEVTFDCIVADPPYNISNKRTYTLEGRKDMTTDLAEWDHFEEDEYLAFTGTWIEKAVERLGDGGNLFLFTSDRYVSFVRRILEDLGMKNMGTIYWHKTNPRPSVAKDKWVSSVELIVHASKGRPKPFNFLGTSEMHNHIETSIVSDDERLGDYPTQKPVEVIEKLLKVGTNVGDTVLDPFAGTGTTAIACNNLKRNWVMIEKKEKYVNMMKTRVSVPNEETED